MKLATIISSIITLLLSLITMTCGLWIQSGQPGDIKFHISCGITSVIFCFITFILLIKTLSRQKGE